ncbi:MAG: sigma 54-interacting transcriptional regulator [SAR324 cluster bacterium]|nr:sigma 54-interacting transcriptional regulator [SAR324 cluster bacterium]
MKKILIIDDEKSIRNVLCEHLSMEGYEVFGAENGAEGLELLEQNNPQVIVLDLKMPRMSGMEFLDQLTSKTKISHSIIILSGFGSNQEIKRCYQLGVQSFLRKPVNLFELSGIIKRSFELRQYEMDLKQEIEARKQAYQQLEKEVYAKENAYTQLEIEHKFLKKTLDSIAEGVVTLDHTFRIQRISEKACFILEMPEEEVIGKPAASMLGSSIAGPTGELMNCVQRRTKVSDIQTQILCPSGAIIPIRLSIIPLNISSTREGWLLLFQDLIEEERLIREKAGSFAYGQMISCDPKMKKIFNLIDKVALSNATVLIIGESGTGKELVAREIHKRSNRAQGSFHAVNCAAISPYLLESEFFGHERGSFTGAHQTKPGHFELTHKGTFFLDEVGEIPLELQGKLLRVLQEQSFKRVGGTKTLHVDVRMIAASNKDLKALVQKKLFREDLYYRLHVVPVNLPPLRERLQDIPILITAFIEELNRKEHRHVRSIAPDALQLLLNYSWRGNVRELYHTIEYAFAVSTSSTLQAHHLPDELQIEDPLTGNDLPLPQNEKELMFQALQKTNFSKPKAAALLGIHRSTFYRKLKRYGMDVSGHA